jgi:hypothetical protein
MSQGMHLYLGCSCWWAPVVKRLSGLFDAVLVPQRFYCFDIKWRLAGLIEISKFQCFSGISFLSRVLVKAGAAPTRPRWAILDALGFFSSWSRALKISDKCDEHWDVTSCFGSCEGIMKINHSYVWKGQFSSTVLRIRRSRSNQLSICLFRGRCGTNYNLHLIVELLSPYFWYFGQCNTMFQRPFTADSRWPVHRHLTLVNIMTVDSHPAGRLWTEENHAVMTWGN